MRRPTRPLRHRLRYGAPQTALADGHLAVLVGDPTRFWVIVALEVRLL